jgi:hypothetical protein
MKQYLEQSEWTIEEHGFHTAYNRISESIFKVGALTELTVANTEDTFTYPIICCMKSVLLNSPLRLL